MTTRMATATTGKAISRSSSPAAPARGFRVYAWAVLGINVFVVLWGALVRATGSGAGCGAHWPTCNGEVVPTAPQLATIIEFTHRATSGLALLAVLGLVIWAFRAFPKGHELRLGAMLSGVFILTEALIGAGLVLLKHVADNPSVYRGWSLSLHLANTFTLLAVLAMTAYGRVRRPSSWTLLAVFTLLGISGAIAALGDTLFPSANWTQDFSPSAHLFIRLRIFHPAIAALATAYALYTVFRQPRTFGYLMLLAIVVQIMVGIMNLTLMAPVWLQLIHLAVADSVWVLAVLYTVSGREQAAIA